MIYANVLDVIRKGSGTTEVLLECSKFLFRVVREFN